MSYAANGQLNLSYATNRATGYLLGNTVVAPVGSNLPAPAPVGRYGATSFSNSTAIGKTASKQIPSRIGKQVALIAFTEITALGGGGKPVPPYGN